MNLNEITMFKGAKSDLGNESQMDVEAKISLVKNM